MNLWFWSSPKLEIRVSGWVTIHGWCPWSSGRVYQVKTTLVNNGSKWQFGLEMQHMLSVCINATVCVWTRAHGREKHIITCLFSLCCQDHFLARAVLLWFVVLPGQMFPHCLTGELRLTGVAEVPGQVERLT